MQDYLESLNEQQREAVTYIDGPQLVIAGAGSGKTRVLTYKIMHLLMMGVEPYRILALTFTNKAAREMKERVAGTVGEKGASRIWMGTFHSVFLRILRRHADRLGFKPDFTIYDASDSRSLVKMIIKDLGLSDKDYKPAAVASIISNAKNSLMTPEAYLADRQIQLADAHANRPRVGTIFKLYVERCRVAGAMDFDDILFYMNVLLRDNADVLRHYQEYFRYILVDEYQDTNFAQHLIISKLAEGSGNLCVVGDDAQSIYSFRGANIHNILSLKRQYPDLVISKLEQNYRSTQNIIEAAGSLIEKNREQIQKKVFSLNEKGDRVTVIKTYSDMEEAALVANRISAIKNMAHDSYADYAVLYRTNAQSRVLEESLRKRNIPYRIYGGLSFYQRKEVKDAICYFRMTVNPSDDEALQRIINYPARGIGDTTVKKLRDAAMASGVSIYEVVKSPETFGVKIHSGTQRKLTDFTVMMESFIAANQSGLDAYSVAVDIYNKSGMLLALAHDKTPESVSKHENLTELLNAIKNFVDERQEIGDPDINLTSFLSEVSLATDQDNRDDDNDEKVTLMTVHAAKGLEFANVFVVGVEEDLFPSSMAKDSIAEIEEERRLLYVAITRAKRKCILTYTGSRFRNGMTVAPLPSRFLSDIDPKYLDMKESGFMADYKHEYVRPSRPLERQPFMRQNTPPARPLAQRPAAAPSGSDGDFTIHSDIAAGTRILHSKFGAGTVTDIEVTSGDKLIYVDFDNMGRRKLLMKFAKFKIID